MLRDFCENFGLEWAAVDSRCLVNFFVGEVDCLWEFSSLALMAIGSTSNFSEDFEEEKRL